MQKRLLPRSFLDNLPLEVLMHPDLHVDPGTRVKHYKTGREGYVVKDYFNKPAHEEIRIQYDDKPEGELTTELREDLELVPEPKAPKQD